MEILLALSPIIIGGGAGWLLALAFRPVMYKSEWMAKGRQDRNDGWRFVPEARWIKRYYDAGWEERDKELTQ